MTNDAMTGEAGPAERTKVAVSEHTDRYGRPLSPDPEAERLETNPAAMHVVVMDPVSERLWAHRAGAGVDWHDRGRWTTNFVLYVPRGYRTGSDRWGIGYSDDTSIWNQGPGLPRKAGRSAFLYELPSVIDNYGGTAAERQRNLEDGVEETAAVGDVVLLITGCRELGDRGERTLWRIVPVGHGGQWLGLELVQR
jgi:hypothetical protein